MRSKKQPEMDIFNFFYEDSTDLLRAVFRADDEDHAWEQFYDEDPETPMVRLVIVGDILDQLIFQE